MPWDGCRLTVAQVTDGDGPVAGPTVVAGGVRESAVEPMWGPDGLLYFLSDRTGWWNLYRWDGTSVHPVAPMDADCAAAPWEGGYRSYAFLPDGTTALTVHDGFASELMLLHPDGRRTRPATGLTSLKPYLAAHRDRVAVIGASPRSTPGIHLLPARADADEDAGAGPAVSTPTLRTVQRPGRGIRYLLHAPTGRTAPGPVPLLVRAHPGPTDGVPLRLDWTVQFFTSRGFAVAEAAYRGSTGQGRAFRQALHGHWGDYDVQDCAAVAEDLLADGTADPRAVFISGASAGGYTALQAACHEGPFTAAVATSAITDPALWTKTAPRFQRPHAAALLGPAGAVRAERIALPVLLVHGTDDEVAPVADVVRLAGQLAAVGADHRTLFLPGTGHYLSAPHSRTAALEAEWDFYRDLMAAAR